MFGGGVMTVIMSDVVTGDGDTVVNIMRTDGDVTMMMTSVVVPGGDAVTVMVNDVVTDDTDGGDTVVDTKCVDWW